MADDFWRPERPLSPATRSELEWLKVQVGDALENILNEAAQSRALCAVALEAGQDEDCLAPAAFYLCAPDDRVGITGWRALERMWGHPHEWAFAGRELPPTLLSSDEFRRREQSAASALLEAGSDQPYRYFCNGLARELSGGRWLQSVDRTEDFVAYLALPADIPDELIENITAAATPHALELLRGQRLLDFKP